MTNYLCNNCNYKFVSNKTSPPKSCPYCGAIGTVNSEISASDLVREAEESSENEKN